MGGFFESVHTPAYGSFRLVQNICLSIKYFGNLPWESFEGLNKSSLQNKIEKYIKEALTEASSILNISRENRAIVLNPKKEMVIYSLLQRRDVMKILSTSSGKRMIITVFAMAKEEISSLKTCMITISPLKSTIDNQISEMLLLSYTAMDLMTETVNFSASRKSTSIFSITRCYIENNALQRTTSNSVRDCGRWIGYSRRKTHSVILHTWCSLSLSYNSDLKIALYIKIQHPASEPSVKTFTDKETTTSSTLYVPALNKWELLNKQIAKPACRGADPPIILFINQDVRTWKIFHRGFVTRDGDGFILYSV